MIPIPKGQIVFAFEDGEVRDDLTQLVDLIEGIAEERRITRWSPDDTGFLAGVFSERWSRVVTPTEAAFCRASALREWDKLLRRYLPAGSDTVEAGEDGPAVPAT